MVEHSNHFHLASRLLQHIDSSLLCCVCKDVLQEAVYLPCCGNSLCGSCLELKEQKCPYDKKYVEKFMPNNTVRNYVNSLRIKCSMGCSAEVTIGSIHEHEAVCEYKVLPCPNHCGGLYSKGEMEMHLVHCLECICAKNQKHISSECECPLNCAFCKQDRGIRSRDLSFDNLSSIAFEAVVGGLLRSTPEVDEVQQRMYANIATNVKADASADQFCLEIFNIVPPNNQIFILHLLEHIDPTIVNKAFIQWDLVEGTWLVINCPTAEMYNTIQKGLSTMGFPFVRHAFDEKGMLHNGNTKNLTFCPPLSKIDCVFAEEHMESKPEWCPFRHINCRGPCRKWKTGVICDHPHCIFHHEGRIVAELKCMARVPNVCKYCQAGRHFGWHCPSAQKAKVIKVVERLVKENGGEMFLSQLGAQARVHCQYFITVLQTHYSNKLRKLLEDYPEKFQLCDLDKPGLAKVKLTLMDDTSSNGSSNGSTVGSPTGSTTNIGASTPLKFQSTTPPNSTGKYRNLEWTPTSTNTPMASATSPNNTTPSSPPNGLAPANGPSTICTNCGRVGHLSSSCNRCSNCSRMHATSQCTQTFPSCGYCYINKRATCAGHRTSSCYHLATLTGVIPSMPIPITPSSATPTSSVSHSPQDHSTFSLYGNGFSKIFTPASVEANPYMPQSTYMPFSSAVVANL